MPSNELQTSFKSPLEYPPIMNMRSLKTTPVNPRRILHAAAEVTLVQLTPSGELQTSLSLRLEEEDVCPPIIQTFELYTTLQKPCRADHPGEAVANSQSAPTTEVDVALFIVVVVNNNLVIAMQQIMRALRCQQQASVSKSKAKAASGSDIKLRPYIISSCCPKSKAQASAFMKLT
jgi:hypothetical protein